MSLEHDSLFKLSISTVCLWKVLWCNVWSFSTCKSDELKLYDYLVNDYLWEYIAFKNHMLLWQEIRLSFSYFEKSHNIHAITKKTFHWMSLFQSQYNYANLMVFHIRVKCRNELFYFKISWFFFFSKCLALKQPKWPNSSLQWAIIYMKEKNNP